MELHDRQMKEQSKDSDITKIFNMQPKLDIFYEHYV